MVSGKFSGNFGGKFSGNFDILINILYEKSLPITIYSDQKAMAGETRFRQSLILQRKTVKLKKKQQNYRKNH